MKTYKLFMLCLSLLLVTVGNTVQKNSDYLTSDGNTTLKEIDSVIDSIYSRSVRLKNKKVKLKELKRESLEVIEKNRQLNVKIEKQSYHILKHLESMTCKDSLCLDTPSYKDTTFCNKCNKWYIVSYFLKEDSTKLVFKKEILKE